MVTKNCLEYIRHESSYHRLDIIDSKWLGLNGKTRSNGMNLAYLALNISFGRLTTNKFSMILPSISLVNVSFPRQVKTFFGANVSRPVY